MRLKIQKSCQSTTQQKKNVAKTIAPPPATLNALRFFRGVLRAAIHMLRSSLFALWFPRSGLRPVISKLLVRCCPRGAFRSDSATLLQKCHRKPCSWCCIFRAFISVLSSFAALPFSLRPPPRAAPFALYTSRCTPSVQRPPRRALLAVPSLLHPPRSALRAAPSVLHPSHCALRGAPTVLRFPRRVIDAEFSTLRYRGRDK